jgi:hypothetical protein
MERANQTSGKLETLLNKTKAELRAYLVDTSAKVGAYALPMGLMEASKGMNFEEIVQSRTSVALADAVLARIYGKLLNKTREKFGENYLVDTATMMAVYVPAYAGILKGIEYFHDKEIDIPSACVFLSGLLIGTARPFGRYVLNPWRKYWGTK